MGITWSKLDAYNYLILDDRIRIKISGASDPILVDILSEIHQTEGKIYVEGHYYQYQDTYDIVLYDEASGMGSYMDLRASLIG